MASAIFVFLESLDEFTGTYVVGVREVTLPLLLFTASMESNYQIASITALLLVPLVGAGTAAAASRPTGTAAGSARRSPPTPSGSLPW